MRLFLLARLTFDSLKLGFLREFSEMKLADLGRT